MARKHTSWRWFRATRLRRFGTEQHGVAAIEFALVVPIIFLLALGCYEVPRFVLIFQKLSRTSASVADLTSQADEAITYGQMQDIFSAGKMIMQPYDVVTNGEIIVSSINNPTGAGAKITWQRAKGTVATGSKIGVQTATPSAALPAGLIPATGEEVLIAEVYFNYTPIFGTRIYSGSQLYSVSYSRPRNNNLLTGPPLTP